MAVPIVCAQRLAGGRRKMNSVQVAAFVAGDVVVAAAYAVRWVAPSFARKHAIVPLAYIVLGVIVLAAALAAKRLTAKSSEGGWQKVARMVLPLVSAVLVGFGCGDVSAHSQGYISKVAEVAKKVII